MTKTKFSQMIPRPATMFTVATTAVSAHCNVNPISIHMGDCN